LKAARATEKQYYSFDTTGRLSLATVPRPGTDGNQEIITFVWERLP
jgi:hypothetical protein